MPRPNKTGLDYFPLDCHLDSSMELIEAEHGPVGFMVIVKLWQMIYGEQGYYCKWEEVNQKAFARRNGLTVSEVSSVVISAITHNLFDKNLADKGVLTSTGIQKRFANMSSKRKVIDVYTDLLLIPIDKLGSKNRDYTTIVNQQLYFTKGIKKKAPAPVISEITTDNSENNGESKQKVNMESKEGNTATEKQLPSEAIAIAQNLFTFHRDRIDNLYKVSDANIATWAQDIDKLNRLDGRSWEDIARLVDFIKQPGEFWASNIMSGKKLRDKFSQIWAKVPQGWQSPKKQLDTTFIPADNKPKRAPKKCGTPGCNGVEDLQLSAVGITNCASCYAWDFATDSAVDLADPSLFDQLRRTMN